jgi:hypothetical protein
LRAGDARATDALDLEHAVGREEGGDLFELPPVGVIGVRRETEAHSLTRLDFPSLHRQHDIRRNFSMRWFVYIPNRWP